MRVLNLFSLTKKLYKTDSVLIKNYLLQHGIPPIEEKDGFYFYIQSYKVNDLLKKGGFAE